jgi:uncharacterized protein involved in copper resistance
MKFRLIVFTLGLTVTSWAQTGSPNTPSSTPATGTDMKASCACCEKMGGVDHHKMDDQKMSSADHDKMMCADHKTMKGCCHDMKDGMSCTKATEEKSATTDDKAGCCSGAKESGTHMDDKDKTAMKCCGEKCERHEHSHIGGSI